MMFRGEFGFLSNMAFVDILLDGVTYRSVEHAFQAAKTLNPLERALIKKEALPSGAKRMGRQVKLRANWDKVKLGLMENFLRQKFNQQPFKDKLLNTGKVELVEDNTWGDIFWGRCDGVGLNNLGKLLMMIRAEIV